MATQRQIEANRRNARKSTGPASVQGKAVSSMNALKTGLFAESEILPWEDAREYEALIERFYHDHQPANSSERHYLDDMIYCEWNLRRLRLAEMEIHHVAYEKYSEPNETFKLGEICYHDPKRLGQLQWRIDSTRRAYDRARKSLLELQAARPASGPAPEPVPATQTIQPASTGIGFVPDTPPEATRPPADPVPSPAPKSPAIGFVPNTAPKHPAPAIQDPPVLASSRNLTCPFPKRYPGISR
jgi:hypothetical protein